MDLMKVLDRSRQRLSTFGAVNRRLLLTASALTALSLTFGVAADADEVSDFYAGKTVTLINGFPPGGLAQASVDVFVKHLQNHIPGNPQVISENMPGAGTLRAANYVFNAADKDGTVIGLFSANILLAHLWQQTGVEFDPREVNWLGSPTRRPTAIALFRTDAPAKTFEEAMEVDTNIGSSGAGASTSVYARLLNSTVGTKFNLVLGYQGNPRILLALEQGEVHGLLGYSWASVKRRQGHLLDNGTLHVIAQLAIVPDPELTEMGVPLAIDYVEDEMDKRIMRLVFGVEEMSRPYALPPGVPEERVAALQQAVSDTVNDPAYIADVKANLPDPIFLSTGQEIADFIASAYDLPEAVIANAIQVMKGE